MTGGCGSGLGAAVSEGVVVVVGSVWRLRWCLWRLQVVVFGDSMAEIDFLGFLGFGDFLFWPEQMLHIIKWVLVPLAADL
ncbi:hypothetical protein HanIR_Chr08g0365581 [Helianthus annuus]|nr:hypothetical protein HanIR_Chr08g0365581 [Helianthus annuus]KAJ0719143.1 hypothetical protein HanLR1_Chr08g0278461 [Helianthus annuus]